VTLELIPPTGSGRLQLERAELAPAHDGITVGTPGLLTAKRSVDIGLALVALVTLLPVALVIAMLVKLTSRGPVFYRQQRVGRDGKLFKLIKFRTMLDGTDKHLESCPITRAAYEANDFKLHSHAPCITKVGRILRALAIDELPQLLNVLAGQMSLVGVRPLLVPELALRSERQQECYKAMRPGMTGLWQVESRSQIARTDRRKLDRDYVENWSLSGDLKILARTPFAVLKVRRNK
jgi:lipopolysaccharide/colanic/teichoic acid biosynthesis glycosyltransferase